jgi:hypothetical protein
MQPGMCSEEREHGRVWRDRVSGGSEPRLWLHVFRLRRCGSFWCPKSTPLGFRAAHQRGERRGREEPARDRCAVAPPLVQTPLDHDPVERVARVGLFPGCTVAT